MVERLKNFVGQVVTEGRRYRQHLHLLSGHNPSQCHATQVLKAGGAAWALPEMHTAISGPSSEDTPISREGTAEAISEGGDSLRGPLVDAPETHQSVISDAGDVPAIVTESHRAHPAVIRSTCKNG